MENDKYTISDLVVATVEQKPVEFEDIFGSLVADRISSAIENRKIEIAQNMFNTADQHN
jgi:predicted oxidoreductase